MQILASIQPRTSHLKFARSPRTDPPGKMKRSFFSRTNADGGNTDDDDGSRSKPQPKAKAGAKKTECLKKGPTAKKKTSPKGS